MEKAGPGAKGGGGGKGGGAPISLDDSLRASSGGGRSSAAHKAEDEFDRALQDSKFARMSSFG
jgi:hypothetical protein